ncbi:guanylate kinase [Zhaonella formicivorans]|uniref:guanylate kinase n=1 Tax=Zhaonella formicivorans TaxID=2528593 RepID=UPI001D124330|nr:guanylate kinase [Zhaonella formicivorans]
MQAPGLLIVLSGPSGAGKGTLCQALRAQMPELKYSVSATTRQPRAGEVEGINYYYITKEKFDEMLAQGEFLEWARVYDNYYGTPKKQVMESLERGEDIILEIDIQGAMQIKKQYPKGVFIFIVPPSIRELEKRITGRGTDSEEVIKKRLSCVQQELTYVSEYDYVVVNDEVQTAVEKLKAIIIAEKCRPQRKAFSLEWS